MKTSLVVIALLVACAGATTVADGGSITFCKGSQLAGTFAAVPGSAGAGNISYTLRLKNTSTSTCSLTGLPQGQLLGRHGGRLPTHVRAAFPGALSAVLVTLHHGQTAKATARFSPDVPGTGEQMMGGPCEPTAYSFRVTADRATATAKMLPPTPVCEHGQLQFSAYGR